MGVKRKLNTFKKLVHIILSAMVGITLTLLLVWAIKSLVLKIIN